MPYRGFLFVSLTLSILAVGWLCLAHTTSASLGSSPGLRATGGNWTLQPSPTTEDLWSVSVLSVDDAWAVGNNGTSAHWDGNEWQLVSTGFTYHLFDVQMLASDDVYAVGTQTIAHWDGSAWTRTPVDISTFYPLTDISITSPGEGWAASSTARVLWRSTGGQWEEVETGIVSSDFAFVNAIAMDTLTHGWAGGFRHIGLDTVAVLYEYVNDVWVNRSNTLPSSLISIDAIVLSPDGSEGWMAGHDHSEGHFLQLVSGVWTLDVYMSTACRNLNMPSLDELWAACGSAIHRIGGEWSVTFVPMQFGPTDVAGLPESDAWAVGRGGQIALYDLSVPPAPTHTIGPSPTPTLTPSSTAIPPSATPVPPTATPIPPTDTPIPPTDTPIPPTDTPIPPTDTPIPPTATPIEPTATSAPSSTPTACVLSFADVPSTNTFYQFVNCLACDGIIGGYPCGGDGEPCDEDDTPYFRPYGDVTRGQIAKIVSNAVGYDSFPDDPMFEDVSSSHPFYVWIQRLAYREIMSGYPCGTVPEEPCGTESKPYFRSGNSATRGQLAKIVSNAAGIMEDPGPQYYNDVPPTNPFYLHINRLSNRGHMTGYPCGGPGEPCDGENRPYFRTYNNVTRGQTSKIVANTFFPGCATR